MTITISILICTTVLYTGCGNATGGGGGGGGGGVKGGNGTVEVNGILYITDSNFGGVSGSILIYDDTTGESGLHTPNRVVSGESTLLDFNIGYHTFIDTAKDKLYVPDGESILVFAHASTMEGNVTPEGVITGSNTGLNFPCGIFVRNNKIYVANNGEYPVYSNEIMVFTAEVYGDVAPIHVITCEAMFGPNTLYVTTLETAYITYDSKKSAEPGSSSDFNDQIIVLNNISTRDGLCTPDRTIKFDQTLPKGVVVDEQHDRLFVALRGGYIYEYDNASTLSGTPTPTHIATAYQPTPIAYDTTNDKLYVMQDQGMTIEVWNNASTIEGTYDNHITISGEGDVWGMGIAVDPTR